MRFQQPGNKCHGFQIDDIFKKRGCSRRGRGGVVVHKGKAKNLKVRQMFPLIWHGTKFYKTISHELTKNNCANINLIINWKYNNVHNVLKPEFKVINQSYTTLINRN